MRTITAGADIFTPGEILETKLGPVVVVRVHERRIDHVVYEVEPATSAPRPWIEVRRDRLRAIAEVLRGALGMRL